MKTYSKLGKSLRRFIRKLSRRGGKSEELPLWIVLEMLRLYDPKLLEDITRWYYIDCHKTGNLAAIEKLLRLSNMKGLEDMCLKRRRLRPVYRKLNRLPPRMQSFTERLMFWRDPELLLKHDDKLFCIDDGGVDMVIASRIKK